MVEIDLYLCFVLNHDPVTCMDYLIGTNPTQGLPSDMNGLVLPSNRLEFRPYIRETVACSLRWNIPVVRSLSKFQAYYERAHNRFRTWANMLTGFTDFRALPYNADLLFSIETTPTFRLYNSISFRHPFKFELPVYVEELFDPSRMAHWTQIFHDPRLPLIMKEVELVRRIIHQLQCILPGVILLYNPSNPSIKQPLPPPSSLDSREARFLDIFSTSRRLAIYEAAYYRHSPPKPEALPLYSSQPQFTP